jgi:hypothetical protein
MPASRIRLLLEQDVAQDLHAMEGLQTLIAALLYSQTKRKPRLRPLDRAFWTVVRWHRKGFRLDWRWISKRGPGRPRISAEVQELIPRFAAESSSTA